MSEEIAKKQIEKEKKEKTDEEKEKTDEEKEKEKEKEKEPIEPILTKNNSRFTNLPIIYEDLWSFKIIQEKALWLSSEIDYQADIKDFMSLSSDEKYFIEHVLAFFAGADGIVMENIDINFSSEVQISEARGFYAVQGYIEQVHSETYSLLIETFIKDASRKAKLFNAIDEIPCIRKKALWAQKWMSADRPFAIRLVAFSIVEGIFFSGSFCAIFWLKNKGLCTKALGHSNELIARDESIHCNFAIALYGHLIKKVSKDEFYKIFREAVAIESEFITESLPCRLVGMNSDLMKQYIKFVADYWISKYGLPKIYNVENPFPFMDMLALENKSNFFEKRVSEYQKAAVQATDINNFKVTDDF
jgi:ribonucleotide reductase beta subunit family protein with ferritin-like domain